jgi:hypothetical protein
MLADYSSQDAEAVLKFMSENVPHRQTPFQNILFKNLQFVYRKKSVQGTVKVKVKISLLQAMEAHRVERG